jgi:hypothetical protein
MTPVSRLLTWVFVGLVLAAAMLAAGYWGYRQMQPRPLFTPASASGEVSRPSTGVPPQQTAQRAPSTK